ncbi:cold shock domain-containing protein [Mycobacteroides abscessus subsp. bolletii]|nr:cold shock domain-containing protein [Mycobacteroides abscessus]MDO2970578.1 cold shock domain-containing protein [Mycobacteroides abscessus subsp. bolletii]MDO3077963.1 cold shock domain-containing protein [Mycobacteroides abscessus subsp. bolletii]MDO3333531.1 cold shock domain-containing protein [Mycobacteroides abscessus subsp. bolletii]
MVQGIGSSSSPRRFGAQSHHLELPHGLDAFAHYTAIEGDGFRMLSEGECVKFDYEQRRQESFPPQSITLISPIWATSCGRYWRSRARTWPTGTCSSATPTTRIRWPTCWLVLPSRRSTRSAPDAGYPECQRRARGADRILTTWSRRSAVAEPRWST